MNVIGSEGMRNIIGIDTIENAAQVAAYIVSMLKVPDFHVH